MEGITGSAAVTLRDSRSRGGIPDDSSLCVCVCVCVKLCRWVGSPRCSEVF